MPVKESKELLEALDAMKKEANKENAEKLSKLLDESIVYIPAVMPKNTDPAILRQMAGPAGKSMPVPKGAQPVPCILQNEEGKKFFPIFTSEEEIAKGTNIANYPITLNMPFKMCLDVMIKVVHVDGAVINPYSHNITMNINRKDDNGAQQQTIKVTEEQFHAIARQYMEATLLPGKIFITLNMPFKMCLDVMIKVVHVDGAVINPYSHNITMNINRKDDNGAQQQTIKVTEEQFHAIARQYMEATLLPGKIFTEGEKFIKDLCKRGGECLVEFFKEPYANSVCPYTADDYDLMTLVISDTLQLTRITMPYENLYPGMAETLFVTWNPEKKKAGYYGILKGRRGEFNKLMEITSEGKAVDYGDAPAEGSELQHIIDIVEAKQDE